MLQDRNQNDDGLPDHQFLITESLNRSPQNVLRKDSLFDKTKAIVSKEERVLLISFTTLNKVKRLSKKRNSEPL